MINVTFTEDAQKNHFTHSLNIQGLLPILSFNLPLTEEEVNKILGKEFTRPRIKRKKLKLIKKGLKDGRLKFFLDSTLKVDDYSRVFNICLTKIDKAI